VRVRTVLTFAAGAAAGAGATYLLDPDAGELRRRQLRRDALHQAKDAGITLAKGGATLTADLSRAAVEGYREARLDAADERPSA
jgi:hypothetical protein